MKAWLKYAVRKNREWEAIRCADEMIFSDSDDEDYEIEYSNEEKDEEDNHEDESSEEEEEEENNELDEVIEMMNEEIEENGEYE